MKRAALLVALGAALGGCPAPNIDPANFDVTPWDATAGELVLIPAPSCAPESVVDLNANGVRAGSRIVITVDTRNASNDLHPSCARSDSTEVVLRYTVPAAAGDGGPSVQAIRVSTITDQTVANGTAGSEAMPDPTNFDTVLSLRSACDSSDSNCDNDAFFQNAAGQSVTTRRSVVWQEGLAPEDVVLIVVDGYDGSAGSAQVTLDEFPTLGVLGAPCLDVPPERAHDPTAATAPFRCRNAPGVACLPHAAPDGTDLCVQTVMLGAACDDANHFNVCDPGYPDVQCAQDPSAQTAVVCALPGTAPGTTCRGAAGTANRCDANLYCSLSGNTMDADYCVQIRRAGESCDPTPFGAINHCADGYQCCADRPDGGTDTTCIPNGTTCYALGP